MVISKQAATAFVDESQNTQIDELQKQIDEAIKKDFVPGDRLIVRYEGVFHQRVKIEVERMYTEAGWKIKFQSDQRDGNWIEIF